MDKTIGISLLSISRKDLSLLFKVSIPTISAWMKDFSYEGIKGFLDLGDPADRNMYYPFDATIKYLKSRWQSARFMPCEQQLVEARTFFGLVFPVIFDSENPVFIAWEWHLSDLLENDCINQNEYDTWLNPIVSANGVCEPMYDMDGSYFISNATKADLVQDFLEHQEQDVCFALIGFFGTYKPHSAI